VDRWQIVDGSRIAPGDALIGLPSTGLHTNGYSLARKICFDVAGWTPDTFVAELGSTVADALLATHRSYLSIVRRLLEHRIVKGLAHITGGGITENLPRVFPEGCGAEIDRGSWSVLPIFRELQRLGGIADAEMFRAFNMGIGLIAVVAADDAERAIALGEAAGERGAVRIGSIVAGRGEVSYR
jgi:phosphoribosylformylglycinamidine cyclo-ligase